MENAGKVGLFGAAGAIGQSIACALGAAGRDYRVIGRSRGSLEAAFGQDPHAEIATWNPDEPASIAAAAQGLQTAVYLVGVPYDQFEMHPVLIRTLTRSKHKLLISRCYVREGGMFTGYGRD
jgi:uncharacterized protein YbjT (DUF2867 family)